MDLDNHYRSLEKMYLSAPINAFFKPKIAISREYTEIEVSIKTAWYHGAQAVHGSVYFKMLDDAAYFAANSIERDYFVLTAVFTTYLTRPVSEGMMKSIGRVVNRSKTQILADSVVYDGQGRELGRGNGLFVRGKIRLSEVRGYGDG
jgi:uncharacterized protein (TIGR00369 family)